MSGPTLPWAKTHELQRIRPGEVTLWGGWPGHGKSAMVNYVALHLLAQEGCGGVELLSLEMTGAHVTAQMLRQLAGEESPDPRWMEIASRWLDRAGLKLQESSDPMTPGQALDAIDDYLMGDRHRHLILDNLSCLSMPEGHGSQEAAKDFMYRVKHLAERHHGHVHLVAHLRKGEEAKMPNQLDIAGSRHYVGMANNVHLVWRNKAKEAAQQLTPDIVAAMTDRELARHELLLQMPDAMLLIDKNRVGGVSGRVGLWFDPRSQQYLPGPDSKPWDFRIF